LLLNPRKATPRAWGKGCSSFLPCPVTIQQHMCTATAKPNLNEVDMETPSLPMTGMQATLERTEPVTGGHWAGSSKEVGRHLYRSKIHATTTTERYRCY